MVHPAHRGRATRDALSCAELRHFALSGECRGWCASLPTGALGKLPPWWWGLPDHGSEGLRQEGAESAARGPCPAHGGLYALAGASSPLRGSGGPWRGLRNLPGGRVRGRQLVACLPIALPGAQEAPTGPCGPSPWSGVGSGPWRPLAGRLSVPVAPLRGRVRAYRRSPSSPGSGALRGARPLGSRA